MPTRDPHPLAGQTVTVHAKDLFEVDDVAEVEYRVEDYWHLVSGGSWMFADGNPACLKYAIRAGMIGLPIDDDVLYGKVGAFGHLIHVSEIVQA